MTASLLPLKNTEIFVAYTDGFGQMSISPTNVSPLFESILDHDWWYMFEERASLVPFFEPLAVNFFEAVKLHGSDVMTVSLDVEYEFSIPGTEELVLKVWGQETHFSEQYSFTKTWPESSLDHINGFYAMQWEMKAATCFVRAITLEPLL